MEKNALKKSSAAFLVLLIENITIKNIIDTIMIAVSLVFRELTKEFINSIKFITTPIYGICPT